MGCDCMTTHFPTMFVDDIFKQCGLFLWLVLYNITKVVYLNAPRFLGGEEGASPHDICARLMGVDSGNFLSSSGREMCDEKISNVCVGRTTIVLTALITYICLYYPPILYKYFLTLWNSKKRREAQEKRKATETLKKNALEFYKHVSILLRTNPQPSAFKDQVDAVFVAHGGRQIQNEVLLHAEEELDVSVLLLSNTGKTDGANEKED